MSPIRFSQYVAKISEEAGVEPTHEGTMATYQVALGNVAFSVKIDKVDAQKRPLVISMPVRAPYSWVNVFDFNRAAGGKLHVSLEKRGNEAQLIWKAPHSDKTEAEWREQFAQFAVLVTMARSFLSGKCVI